MTEVTFFTAVSCRDVPLTTNMTIILIKCANRNFKRAICVDNVNSETEQEWRNLKQVNVYCVTELKKHTYRRKMKYGISRGILVRLQ